MPKTQKMNFSYKVEPHEDNDASSNKAKVVTSVIGINNRDKATMS